MLIRFGAAIGGAAMLLACTSAATARTETGDLTKESVTAGIVGVASMYDPTRPGGYESGGQQTADGERYDPSAWAAAIQTRLRGEFGGVRGGKKPGYALIESGGKKVVVKINDVGPLEPGRVVDLDRQAMRYFDPSMARGVIHNIRVTPLHGDHYKLGPVG